jgi:hypothetical protein
VRSTDDKIKRDSGTMYMALKYTYADLRGMLAINHGGRAHKHKLFAKRAVSSWIGYDAKCLC